MKKIFLFILVSFTFLTALSAQTTQEEADEIVQERMSSETKFYAVYAKEDVQPEGITITTTLGEVLEIDYPCWVYYVNYTNETKDKYLIVKENSGNLLEINVRNDARPDNLAEWRTVFPIKIPFTEYSGSSSVSSTFRCVYPNNLDFNPNGSLTIINSYEEMEHYVSCTDSSFFDIDFSKQTLLLACGRAMQIINRMNTTLLKNGTNEYTLNVIIRLTPLTMVERWYTFVLTSKIDENAIITLNYQQVK